MASSILRFSVSEKPGQCPSGTLRWMGVTKWGMCLKWWRSPLTQWTGPHCWACFVILGWGDTNGNVILPLCLWWKEGAPICPSCVPLRFHETGVWLCCSELRNGFFFFFLPPLSFLPFVSFSTLTVPNVQSALITKSLLFRKLTYYANYTWHLYTLHFLQEPHSASVIL